MREFNDYLEEIEIIVFNLTHNIDVVETNKRIELYKKENKETIMKNKAKIGKVFVYNWISKKAHHLPECSYIKTYVRQFFFLLN